MPPLEGTQYVVGALRYAQLAGDAAEAEFSEPTGSGRHDRPDDVRGVLRLRSRMREGGAEMVEVKRREFLASVATAAMAVLADDEKLTDGGYAAVTKPGVPARLTARADGLESATVDIR